MVHTNYFTADVQKINFMISLQGLVLHCAYSVPNPAQSCLQLPVRGLVDFLVRSRVPVPQVTVHCVHFPH